MTRELENDMMRRMVSQFTEIDNIIKLEARKQDNHNINVQVVLDNLNVKVMQQSPKRLKSRFSSSVIVGFDVEDGEGPTPSELMQNLEL